MAGIHNVLAGAAGVPDFTFTVSSNQTNANLRTLAVNAGWDQNSKVVATINSGIYISSNSTGTPALTVNGSFPGGVELVNNGIIVGMGGAGGRAADIPPANRIAGSAGGLALSVSVAITITNNNTIAGGGGGGAGGRTFWYSDMYGYGGSAGGGGGGGRSSNAANSSGGGQAYSPQSGYSAAGGSGTVSGAGAGGVDSYTPLGGSFNNYGGSGGGWGSTGSNAPSGNSSGYNVSESLGPGSGGGAVSGNGNITWLATGTRLGGIS